MANLNKPYTIHINGHEITPMKAESIKFDTKSSTIYNESLPMTFTLTMPGYYKSTDIIYSIWKSYSDHFGYTTLYCDGRYAYAWVY